MKKTLALLMTVVLLLPVFAYAQEGTLIDGTNKTNVPVKAEYRGNPVLEGISPTTGLPFTGKYAPVFAMIDNAIEAYPHWGVGQADIIYQLPHAGHGATRLMAMFSDKMPESVGGVRSARTPFLDVVFSYGGAFVFAGTPGEEVAKEDNVPLQLYKAGYRFNKEQFDVLQDADFRTRVKHHKNPHNLSVNIKKVQELALNAGVEFEQRPFLFTDELPQKGEKANFIEINHYRHHDTKKPNPASAATYTYDAEKGGYIRETAFGKYADMQDQDNPIVFANVIVQRVRYGWNNSYVHLLDAVGSGDAQIFIGGRFIQGAWYKNARDGRTVYLDENGNEIKLQRGKTFIVVGNEDVLVSYK